ncbi:MAG: TolC family protein [Candidatus Wallbacteria bacterium]|nr:TolC family protein [Candidatus Wallbacteria bacterium]
MKLFLLFTLIACFPSYCALPDKLSTFLDYAFKNSQEYRQLELSHQIDIWSSDLQFYSYKPKIKISGDDSNNRSLSVSDSLDDGLSLNYGRSETLGTPGTGLNSITLSSNILTSLSDYSRRILKLSREDLDVSFTRDKEQFKLKVINAAYDLMNRKMQLEVQKESLTHWKNTYDLNNAKFKLGSSDKLSLLNAEVNYLQQENNVVQSEKSLNDGVDQFKILIGYSFTDTLEINQELTAEAYDWIKIPLYSSFDERLSEHSLEKKELQYRSARNQAPGDLALNSTFQSGSTRSYSGTLSYTFNLGEQKNALTAKSAEFSRNQGKLAHELQRKQSESDRREIIRRYDALKKTLEVSKKRKESAEESYGYALISIQKGMLSLLDLQDAQQKLTSAQLDYLNATIDFNKLKYEIINTFGGTI